MEQKETAKKKSSTKVKSQSGTIRLSKDTIKKIASDLAKINKKELGRKVKAEAYMVEAISGMNEAKIEKLRQNSLTPADKTRVLYQTYCKNHGQITFEEFNFQMAQAQLKALNSTQIDAKKNQHFVEENGGK